MRGGQIAVIVGGCAVLVTAGFAAAPPLKPASDPVASPDPTSEPGDTPSGAQTFDGPPISNARGTYQAQITVVDGVVTDVIALEAGTSAPESVQVNTMAIPQLKAEVLEAQTWDVEAISGASFTSPAFIESLQGAFADAGLS
jgi:uncharacterized protein with FMN-binding domain